MKAIYKIENKINHKVYIGQSKNPEERFFQHCNRRPTYKSLIYDAIQKYGKENFSFEVLGWFEDYNEKEKYYIQCYHSIVPGGYNIAQGGEEPPHGLGEKNSFVTLKYMKETNSVVTELIQNGKVTQKQDNPLEFDVKTLESQIFPAILVN